MAGDLIRPVLPAVVEEYLVGERAWNRLLRGTGAVTAEELTRWLTSPPAG